MSDVRYLLDENIPPVVQEQLLSHEPRVEILRIGDEGALPLGRPDSVILKWIERNGYILVSQNRRTVPMHLREHLTAGHHVPGILLLRHKIPLGQLLDDLLLIWNVSKPDEYRGLIEYLPL